MADDSLKKIAQRLKSARKRSGLTQAALADKAGISANYYALVERGVKDPSTSNMTKIIEALGISASDILDK